jgi:hypothetical protein
MDTVLLPLLSGGVYARGSAKGDEHFLNCKEPGTDIYSMWLRMKRLLSERLTSLEHFEHKFQHLQVGHETMNQKPRLLDHHSALDTALR